VERTAQPEIPAERYIRAEYVMAVMGRFGKDRLERFGVGRVLVLSIMAGGFITVGALFSMLLGVEASSEGMLHLFEGIGFSTGFFFVVLSETILFTEANVVIPATMLETKGAAGRVLRFWILAWVGNFAGAFLFGTLIARAQDYSPQVMGLLSDTIALKMSFQAHGGVTSWLQIVVSGMLANWLVGMAAFFSMMARTIFGKYIPVALAVTLFVAANFQHSPANMGYFSLFMAETAGPGWGNALWWNIVPAGIGNVIGGTLFVALPFWWAFTHRGRSGRGSG